MLSLARTALEVGRETFDAYSHSNSPKKFTQPQLFAMLALRQQWGTGYAATATRLGEWPQLCQMLGLRHIPDGSTLYHAEGRLLKKVPRSACWIRPSASADGWV